MEGHWGSWACATRGCALNEQRKSTLENRQLRVAPSIVPNVSVCLEQNWGRGIRRGLAVVH